MKVENSFTFLKLILLLCSFALIKTEECNKELMNS